MTVFVHVQQSYWLYIFILDGLLIGQDLSCLVGHLVGLWGCDPSPLFLKGDLPFIPPQVSHLSVKCMCTAVCYDHT